jgi:hypothetical protein
MLKHLKNPVYSKIYSLAFNLLAKDFYLFKHITDKMRYTCIIK